MHSDILLRPLDPVRDGPDLHAIFGNEDCCRYLPRAAFNDVAETIAQLVEWNNGYGDTSWTIAETQDGEALGRIAFYPSQVGILDNVWEVACMVAPKAQGQGLARRALEKTIPQIFEIKKARRIFADVDPDNVPSLRTFEQLGFTKEGRLRALWKTHIGVRDTIIFSLIDTDPRPLQSASARQ